MLFGRLSLMALADDSYLPSLLRMPPNKRLQRTRR